ncbi:MAG: hypothetical protein ACRDXE_04705 [Acidimicrobiales bacterium]
MSSAATCAAPGCEQPVHRANHTGRPAIYCSPQCRPSRNPTPRRAQIVVEIEHPDISPDGRPADRVWTVQLRRGQHRVAIADDLGWPSANALAHDLNALLNTNPSRTGGAID